MGDVGRYMDFHDGPRQDLKNSHTRTALPRLTACTQAATYLVGSSFCGTRELVRRPPRDSGTLFSTGFPLLTNPRVGEWDSQVANLGSVSLAHLGYEILNCFNA